MFTIYMYNYSKVLKRQYHDIFKPFSTVHKLHMATRAPGSEAKQFYKCFPFRDTKKKCDFKGTVAREFFWN